jgi:hypothetical protein
LVEEEEEVEEEEVEEDMVVFQRDLQVPTDAQLAGRY